MEKTIVLKPRISEKAYEQSVAKNTYVVDVPVGANKDVIAKAVATQFGVTVEAVNTTVAKGKSKRTVRKGGRSVMGKRSDVKKAYVTLKEGDKLPFFAEVEAEAEKASKKSGDKNDKKKQEKQEGKK